MAASVFEMILARVQALLLGATAAGVHVYLAREDAFGADELPAINLRRENSNGDVIGNNGERHVITFALEIHVDGADPETQADALHMAAHALLLADATLASRGRGLRLTATETLPASADRTVARLTARYQMQVFTRPGDLTRAVT